MQRFFNRRSAAVAAVVLSAQALSACVVVPAPYYRPRAVVVEPQRGDWHRGDRDDRRWGDEGRHAPEWDGRR